MKLLFHHVGMDASFAPAMSLVVSQMNHRNIITSDSLLQFFTVLMHADLKTFFRLIFEAIDADRDGTWTKQDLIGFGTLIQDPLNDTEAEAILHHCETATGAGFAAFWNWYKGEHGMETDENDLNFCE
jgi:Ca2+-binding EF-hand superfamily protein